LEKEWLLAGPLEKFPKPNEADRQRKKWLQSSVVFDASLLSTGIYVYSFEAWNYTAHGKVLLLK